MMKSRMKFISIGALIVVGAGAAFANHSWGNYHWARTSNPFTLKLGDNVTSAWDSYLATTSSDWSKSSVLDTVIVPGQATNKRCRPTTGRVEVCNASYGFNGWLGVAGINISGSHITAAYVKLNDSYFNTATYNTPAWRNLVMCQEVGHAFGLDHQDETFDNPNLGTCMDYTNNPSTNQHPNQHDYEQLETIYAHLDSTTTVGQRVDMRVAARADDDDEIPAAVVAARARSFAEDLGGGRQRITFIYWAPDFPGNNDHHHE